MPKMTKMTPFSTKPMVSHTLFDCSFWRAVCALCRCGSSDMAMPAATTAMTPPICSCSAAR